MFLVDFFSRFKLLETYMAFSSLAPITLNCYKIITPQSLSPHPNWDENNKQHAINS